MDNKTKILVVDDDPSIISFLREILECDHQFFFHPISA